MQRSRKNTLLSLGIALALLSGGPFGASAQQLIDPCAGTYQNAFSACLADSGHYGHCSRVGAAKLRSCKARFAARPQISRGPLGRHLGSVDLTR